MDAFEVAPTTDEEQKAMDHAQIHDFPTATIVNGFVELVSDQPDGPLAEDSPAESEGGEK